MRVKMLRNRLYRGCHLEEGRVTDMDGNTARWFIEKLWAVEYQEPAPLTTETAKDLIGETGVKRRRALR